MRKLLFLLLLVSGVASAQYQPTGSKTRFVQGIGLGTKSDAAFGTVDSLVLYTKADSTLMFKYKGTARALAYASQLGDYVTIAGTQTITGAKTFTSSLISKATGNDSWVFQGRQSATNNILGGIYQNAIGDGVVILYNAAGTENGRIGSGLISLNSGSISSVVDALVITNSAQNNAGLRQVFKNGYGNLGAVKISQVDNGSGADDGTIEFQTATDAALSTKLTIGNTGNVNLSSLGTGTVYSNSGTLTNTDPSDSTIKNTIKPLGYGLAEVLKLQPKTFYYNSDSSKTSLKYGFIAQEVQKIMPDMVRKINPKDDKSKLGLESQGIYVTLVKAIQEQQDVIDDLKKRIIALENK